MIKIPGIYKIVNKINNKVYVGSSKNVSNRWSGHKQNLKHNKNSPNKHLQRSWNKYGKENFQFIMLESIIVERKNEQELKTYLAERENYWKDFYRSNDPKCGYNKLLICESSLGYKHTIEAKKNMSEAHKGKKLSLEHRKKLSEVRKGRIVSKETREKISIAHFGMVRSSEARKNMSLAHFGKCGEKSSRRILTEEQVFEIIKKYKNKEGSYSELAQEYGVSKATISHIITGISWSSITGITKEEKDE